MADSVFDKIFLITCTGFRLRQWHQTAVLHPYLWKLPHGRYSPAKHHVSEVHLTGYASYFNKKSNLSSKLISRSKKLTSEQASWIFLKNYLGILRPGSNCSQVLHQIPQKRTQPTSSLRYVPSGMQENIFYQSTYLSLSIYTAFHGVPFYYVFPIYGYPKFIFGYPKIHNSFLDIQKSIYGYPKIRFWISKNQLIIGYP